MHQKNLFEGDAKPSVKRREPDGKEPTRDKILRCTSCELYANGRGPVPYRGPHPSRVAIVGEAPGREEDSKGGPFLGPAGLLLQSELRVNKVVPDRLFWMNVVSCFPLKTPTLKHIRACMGNCFAQLDLCDPQWVILVGGVALEALAPWEYWRGKHKKITEMHCIPWHFGGRWWVPIVHPAAGLRQPKYMEMFRRDVRIVVSMIRAGIPEWTEECYNCGLSVQSYDQWGMAWCDNCNPRV